MSKHTLFVCQTCAYSKEEKRHEGKTGGQLLFESLMKLKDQWPSNLEVKPAKCMSNCKRSCSITLNEESKRTLFMGELSPTQESKELIELVKAYIESNDGRVKKFNRPEILKQKLCISIPHLQKESEPSD
jgi:predicted metal-binding protein